MMKKNLEDDDGVISQKDNVSPAQLFEVRENTTQ